MLFVCDLNAQNQTKQHLQFLASTQPSLQKRSDSGKSCLQESPKGRFYADLELRCSSYVKPGWACVEMGQAKEKRNTMTVITYLLVGIAQLVLQDGLAVRRCLQLSSNSIEGFNQFLDQLQRVHVGIHGNGNGSPLGMERLTWHTLVLGVVREGNKTSTKWWCRGWLCGKREERV